MGGIVYNAINVYSFADTGCNLNGLPLQRMAFNLKTTIDKITHKNKLMKIQENLMSSIAVYNCPCQEKIGYAFISVTT